MKFSPNVFSIVTYGLTITLILEVVAYVVLAFAEQVIPEELVRITLANFAGLLGLLTKVSFTESEQIVNSARLRGTGAHTEPDRD